MSGPSTGRRATGRRPAGAPEGAPGAAVGGARVPLPLLAAALLAALLGPAAPSPASAQAELTGWVFEARVGASSPRGDLGDVADDGQMLGLALGYRLLPRLTLRAEGVVQNLGRGGDPEQLGGTLGPDVELWHYLGVASLELTDPVRSRWEVVLHGGAGGTRVDAGPFGDREAVTVDEPTVTAAVDGGYDFSRQVTLFFRADGYLILGDTSDPAPARPAFPGEETVLTHTVGLRFSF